MRRVHAALLIFALGAVARPSASFTPTDIGSELYAWGWAGANHEHVTLVDGPNGKLISFMQDLSGNGNTFVRAGGNKPATQASLTLPASTKGGAYSTSLPPIGLDKYVPGQQIYGNIFDFTNPLVDGDDFYLAAVYMNTRTGGTRDLWGNDAAGWVRIDQSREEVTMNIGGTVKQISLDASHPKGITLLEIWRDGAGTITCFANGKDITNGALTMAGTLTLNGTGYDGAGSSQWDDFSMEFLLCNALPPAGERGQLREYLRAKWNIFPAAGPNQDSSFEDDFEDGTFAGWSASANAAWTEAGGKLCVDAFTGGVQARAAPSNHQSRDATVAATVEFVQVPAIWHTAAVQSCKADPSDGPGASGYAFEMRSNGFVRLRRNGAVLATASTGIDGLAGPVVLELRVNDGTLVGSVDGTAALTVSDPSPLAKGYAGVSTYRAEVCFLDFKADVAPVAAFDPPDGAAIPEPVPFEIRILDVKAGGAPDPTTIDLKVGLNGNPPTIPLGIFQYFTLTVEPDASLTFLSTFNLPDGTYSEVRWLLTLTDSAGNVTAETVAHFPANP